MGWGSKFVLPGTCFIDFYWQVLTIQYNVFKGAAKDAGGQEEGAYKPPESSPETGPEAGPKVAVTVAVVAVTKVAVGAMTVVAVVTVSVTVVPCKYLHLKVCQLQFWTVLQAS